MRFTPDRRFGLPTFRLNISNRPTSALAKPQERPEKRSRYGTPVAFVIPSRLKSSWDLFNVRLAFRRPTLVVRHGRIPVGQYSFEFIYRRLVVRLGHAQAIGAIAHRLCRLIWMILHQAIRYEERGPAVSRSTTERRAAKMIRELRRLGYRIEPTESEA